jgi:4-hydroxybenzoate polyprenyltransferase
VSRALAGRIIAAVLAFVSERFAPLVSIPMALALASGAADEGNAWRLARLTVAVWLALLAARAMDDIADLELDRVRKPERGLAAGRIDPKDLAWGAVVCLLLASCALGARPSWAMLGFAACIVSSTLYYSMRERLRPSLRPLWLNAPFFALPLWWPLEAGRVTPIAIAIAAFTWLSVVGHDYAHSIEVDASAGDSEWRAARLQTGVGATLYLVALILGGWIGFQPGERAFLVTLGAMGIWVAVLLVPLLRAPTSRAAGRLYVPGGLFYLVPLLGRHLSQYL